MARIYKTTFLKTETCTFPFFMMSLRDTHKQQVHEYRSQPAEIIFFFSKTMGVWNQTFSEVVESMVNRGFFCRIAIWPFVSIVLPFSRQ